MNAAIAIAIYNGFVNTFFSALARLERKPFFH
jgi:hypothetical protein